MLTHHLQLGDLHNKEHFLKHCEIVEYLLQRKDVQHPAVKHHIRGAIREASNHASSGPGYDSKIGAQYMSVKARDKMQEGNFRDLIGEHIVPVSTLNEIILTNKNPKQDRIAKILLRFGARAVITNEEHESLKKHELSKNMPSNWNSKNIFERYRIVGIRLEQNRYSEFKKLHSK